MMFWKNKLYWPKTLDLSGSVVPGLNHARNQTHMLSSSQEFRTGKSRTGGLMDGTSETC